jgi:hypothetical protein
LAMENTDAQDDIDLMIVARANRLWLTRLIVVPAVSTIANRRKPSKHSNSEVRESWVNAICLNLFLDEDNLAVPKRKRNLYTAHEVGQAKPVIDKDGTYESFLRNNTWVDEYLPNLLTGLVRKRKKKTLRRPPNHSLDFLERLAFKSQKVYMRSKRTREIVQRNAAFFHPRDTERLILNEYRRRLQSLTSAQGKSHKKGRGRERDK